jgi:hypothetical protein
MTTIILNCEISSNGTNFAYQLIIKHTIQIHGKRIQ